jgi:hypothetical protein
MSFPPLPQPSGAPNYEEFLDMLAYLLATSEPTQEISWIIGDVGMGAPQQTPFAYISPRNDTIPWKTAGGSRGGMTGGPQGLDDHLMTVPMTVAVEPHQYLKPIQATPPVSSPVSQESLGVTLPFFEQPGYRAAMGVQRRINQVLRENITLGGEIISTTIVETTYLLQKIESDVYRALRITLQAQQRRVRGT